LGGLTPSEPRGKNYVRSVYRSQLRGSIRGQLIQPSDEAYDQARRVYNAMIDKRPGLIVMCADVADVIATIDYARENRMLAAIRGGGHNGGGLGTWDGGLASTCGG
jgi:hypothetical protein